MNIHFLLLLLGIFASCDSGQQEQEVITELSAEVNTEINTQDRQLRIRTKTVHQQSEKPSYTISGEYAFFYRNDSSAVEFNRLIEEEIYKRINKFKADVQDAFEQEELTQEYTDSQSKLNIKSTLHYHAETFLSLEFKYEEDQPMGTYFPHVDFTFLNYNLSSNQQLKLEDLLQAEQGYVAYLSDTIFRIHQNDIQSFPEERSTLTLEKIKEQVKNGDAFYITAQHLVLAIIDNGWSKTEVDFYLFKWEELENKLTDSAKEELLKM